MKNFEVKNIPNSVKDVDSTSRRVKVAISHTSSKDNDNDVIDRNAYNVTIKQRGPGGANLIWHLTDHTPSLKSAVGKFSELYMEGEYLIGVTNIPNTTWGNDVLEFYKSGTINQHSVGFRTINSTDVKSGSDTYRLIKEIMLFEGSAVLWGANENTPTLSVGKSLTKEETEIEFNKLMKELSGLHKMFKLGHLSDNTYELIELKMNQLELRLQELFISQPVQKTVDETSKTVTDDKALINALKAFTASLKAA